MKYAAAYMFSLSWHPNSYLEELNEIDRLYATGKHSLTSLMPRINKIFAEYYFYRFGIWG